MVISIGSDHAGFPLKEEVVIWLKEHGYTVEDEGCFGPDSVDYPDFGAKVAHSVSSGHADKGIVICGTGLGISMSANKVKGIRAALCHNAYTAEMARLHNDANVLAMGARVTGVGVALNMVHFFLKTDFEGGRHQRRVDKIMALEHE